MSGQDEYKLKIDAYSPETIPMERLAKYMGKFASLLGEQKSVHFVRVESGSTALVSKIEQEARNKVRARVNQVSSPDAPKDLKKTADELNEMLRVDGAIAEMILNGENIVRFPGRELVRPTKMGPFNQPAQLVGVLVWVGGQDTTAHASLENSDGETFNCVVSRHLAREMAPYLFGAPLRVDGVARWVRLETGEWDLQNFAASSFEPLHDDDLATAVARLRAIDAAWKHDDDPVTFVRKLRGDDEIH